MPSSKLTDRVITGWAPGSDGLAAPNGSPIWVTALAATTIYADFDQNGTVDFSQAVQPLQSIRIYDNGDRDQSGMKIYTNDGTLITAAWGEDRSTANPARPNIDVGTVALPYREAGYPSLTKAVALLTDVNGNGKYDPGDTARYTIVAANPSGSPVTGAVLTDALPAGVTLVGGSVKLNGGSVAPSTFPTGALNLPNPAAGPGTMPPNSTYTIVFDVTINAGTAGQTLVNTATLTTNVVTLHDDATFKVPDAPTPPVCGVDITTRFTDNSGADVSFVLEGGTLFVTVLDTARTKNNSLVESIQATITNLGSGDVETITLEETNASSNTFRNTTGLPVSESSGTASQDGTLNGRPGENLQADYTNDLWGLTCNDTAVVAGPTQAKILYLSDPGQALDRIDPVATSDTTTATSVELGVTVLETIAFDNSASAVEGCSSSGVVSFDNSSSGVYNGTTENSVTRSWTHTINTSQGNRVVLVGISTVDEDPPNITSITYGGAAMTQVGSRQTNNETHVWLYKLDNPPTGGSTVSFTLNANEEIEGIVYGAASFYGADIAGGSTDTPVQSSSSSLSVASAVGAMVFDTIGDDGTNLSVDSGQTADWDSDSGKKAWGGGSHEAGVAGNVTMSWSSSSKPAHIAVNINAAPAGCSTGVTISNFTTGSGSNRMMLVGVSIDLNSPTAAVSSISYGAQALTKVGDVINGSAERVEIWKLANPNNTTANIVVTMNGQTHNGIVAGAATFSGVNQTTPSTMTSNTGTSTAPTVNVTSAGGQWVFDTVAAGQGAALNVGAGQTARWNATDSLDIAGGGSTEAGAATTTMSWTSANVPWAIGAVAMQPFASGSGVPTIAFTQTLPMQSNFTLPAGGQITVMAYVNVTSGSMPANPNITAVLKKNDGTVLATLTNPSFSGGLLTWTGAMGSNQTVAAGEQVVLQVTTAQSGVSFTIRYDSSTYPSRISLPTNTVINVDDLSFYDAPYPLGNKVTSATVGQTLFVRAQVSDPFGHADIRTTTLNINGTPIVMGAGNVVSAAGAVKIFEYAWQTPPPSSAACKNTYPVSITSVEGYETSPLISATASTNITVTCDDSGSPCAANFLDALGGSIVSTYSAGATVFMRVVDYDHIGGGTVSVNLSGTNYTLNESPANSGIFQGADSTIPGGATRTLTYSDATAVPAGSDMCVVDISAPGTTPGISVRKTLVSPASGPAVVGQQVTFDIAVSNSGNATLNPVQVVDTFDPAKLQFDNASPAQSSTTSNSITWNNIGSLAPGASKTLRVTFVATANTGGGTTTNNVTATGTPPTGPTVNSNSSAVVQIIGPSVAITKTTLTPANRQAVIGDLVTFRMVVTNNGDSVLDVVPLIDSYDTYCFAYISANPAPNATGSGVLFWGDLTQTFAGNLAVNASFTVDVNLLALQACDPAVNSATVQGATDVGGNSLQVVQDDDYVTTAQTYDFGDGPDSFGTLLASDGARHALGLFQRLLLGTVLPDAEANGQPNAAANGDDTAGTDDEDAFASLLQPVAGETSYTLTVPVSNTTGSQAILYAWMDFDGNGIFGASEGVSVSVPYNAGSANLSWSGVNITTTVGATTYARLRITNDLLTDNVGTAVDERSRGLASNGELEDYAVEIAPNPAYSAAIGDYVWYDANNNGKQDVNEPGLGNVTLALRNSSNSVVQTTTTDANGGYIFTDIAPGIYTVDVADSNGILTGYNLTVGPQSSTDPTAAIVLDSTTVYRDADFGYVQAPPPGTAVIGDTVWWDNNQNGVRDPSELGIPSITVQLKDAGGAVVDTTVTDPNGNYLFSNVTPGTYTVNAVTPPGNPDPAAPNPTAPFTVSAGEQYLDADIGRVPVNPATVGGTVWNDTAPNGVLSGEPGLPNVTVSLLDSSGAIIATTTTDSSGNYTFTVPAGTYKVTVSDTHNVLDDFTLGPLGPSQGTDNNSQAQPYPVTVAAGQTNTTADFGYVSNGTPGQTGVLGGTVWVESDKDGLYEPLAGEVGAAGVTVDLLDNSNNVIMTTTTGADGGYVFTSLPAGTYKVQVIDTQDILVNYTPTLIVGGTADSTNKAQPYSVVLPSGGINTTADFGYVQAAPDYVITKTLNTGSPVRKGETISFTIRITNTGNVPITLLPLRDTYIEGILTYTGGSPIPSLTAAGQQDWADLTENTASGFNVDLAVGQTFAVVVEFVGLTDTSALPGGVTINTATVRGAVYDPDGPGGNAPLPIPDKSATAGVGIINPTSVALANAQASYSGGTVQVRWQSVNESDVIGYHVYRSEDGGEAIQLTGAMIDAKKPGQSNGASYEYADTGVEVGKRYSYFVEFIGADGPLGQESVGEVATGAQVFLPRVGR